MLLTCARLAVVLLLPLALWCLGELQFLAPYKRLLLAHYLWPALVFTVVLYLNLVALFYTVSRYLGLGHTGRRLQHVERQLRSRDDSINPELTERLRS